MYFHIKSMLTISFPDASTVYDLCRISYRNFAAYVLLWDQTVFVLTLTVLPDAWSRVYNLQYRLYQFCCFLLFRKKVLYRKKIFLCTVYTWKKKHLKAQQGRVKTANLFCIPFVITSDNRTRFFRERSVKINNVYMKIHKKRTQHRHTEILRQSVGMSEVR